MLESCSVVVWCQNRAAEEALAEGNALAKHLESSLLKDLNKLDADALKLRIIQLTGEMQERTKWEVSGTHGETERGGIEGCPCGLHDTCPAILNPPCTGSA